MTPAALLGQLGQAANGVSVLALALFVIVLWINGTVMLSRTHREIVDPIRDERDRLRTEVGQRDQWIANLQTELRAQTQINQQTLVALSMARGRR